MVNTENGKLKPIPSFIAYNMGNDPYFIVMAI